METPLTILYTHRLRGDLDVLPRLYTFLRQLKAYYTSEEVVQVCALDPAKPPGTTLVLDLGDSCAPDVWHCQVSGGRSTLVVLDGMGYDAALVEDAAVKAEKMGEGVRMKLVDETRPIALEDALFTGRIRLEPSPNILTIHLAPASKTYVEHNNLFLSSLSGGQQVGVAQLAKVMNGWSLVNHEIQDLPRKILPDPTIAAAVEFVISEARYAQKRRSS